MVQRMDETAKGTGQGSRMFEQLGISVTDATGKMKSQEQVFEETVRALQNMPDGAEKSRLAFELFGKAGMELMPLLNGTNESLDDMKKMAHDMGMVLSDDAVDAGVQFTDTMDQLKRSLGAVFANLGVMVMPLFQDFSQLIFDNMPMIQSVISKVFDALSGSFEAVLPLLMDLITNALPPLIDLFIDIAENILPPVITLFTDIIQAILPPLIELFTGYIQTVLPIWIKQFEIIINDILPPFIKLFNDVISVILPPLMNLFNQIISTLLPPLIDLFGQIIDAIMPVLIELFTTFVEIVLPPLMELIDEIVAVVLPPLLEIFGELAEIVLPLVMTVFEAMMPVIEPAMKAISAIIKTVLALIKGDWEGAWNGIKQFFSSYIDYTVKLVEGFKKTFVAIFEGISKAVLAIWDGLVEGIKGAINFIIGGINAFIKGINSIKIPDWVPGVGGKGINIGEIPMLAEGGIVEQSGRVLVGEKGPEFLDLPRGAKVSPLAAGSANIYVELDGRTIASVIGEPLIDEIRLRTGLRI